MHHINNVDDLHGEKVFFYFFMKFQQFNFNLCVCISCWINRDVFIRHEHGVRWKIYIQNERKSERIIMCRIFRKVKIRQFQNHCILRIRAIVTTFSDMKSLTRHLCSIKLKVLVRARKASVCRICVRNYYYMNGSKFSSQANHVQNITLNSGLAKATSIETKYTSYLI